jgi:hypothetical protein
MPTQYCFVVTIVVVVAAVVFSLVGAKHKFDFMFVVNRTLTNGEQWKVMKTDSVTTPICFLHKDYWEISDPSHDIMVQALLVSQ